MRLLFRSTNWLGDVVLSLPALRALRKGHPSAHLAVLCRPWVADLYRLRPEVDEVLVEDPAGKHAGGAGRRRLATSLRAARFDRAVILPRSFGTAWTVFNAGIPERIGYRGEGRGPLLTTALPFRRPAAEHEVFRHLALAVAAGGAADSLPDVSWHVPGGLAEIGRAVLMAAGWDGAPFLAAHVVSFANTAKRWPVDRFAETFERLAGEEALPVVLLGSRGERMANEEAASRLRRTRGIDLSGRTGLADLLGVLSLASLFVGNDSGVAHLANAVGIPTVVVFGPTDPEGTRPWDGPRGDGKKPRVAVVRRPPLCAPCRFRFCPIDHGCMRAVSPDDVVAACRAVRPD